jgi:signal transduction histidine kinase
MPDLGRLKHLGIWLPVVAIAFLFGFIEALDVHLHQFWGGFFHEYVPHWLFHTIIYLGAIGAVAVGSLVFSNYIFDLIHQKDRAIRRQNQELAALNAVGAAINESLDLDAVLSRALDRVLEVTGAESGEIFLQEEHSGDLVLHAFHGIYAEAFREMTRFKQKEGFPGLIAVTGVPLVVNGLREDPRFLRKAVKDAGFQSYAGLPLRSKGKIVGVMGVFAMDPGRLKSEDLDLLAALGNQIGLAIEHASLYARVKEMSIGEERRRIAREMHDGLAQNLGYLHLKMEEVEAKATACPMECPNQDGIRLMKSVTAEAYDEVRQGIFGLKMVSRHLGLVPALTEYLRDFMEHTGISTELRVADERATRLSPRVEIQLIRIIQEALANVRRHAQARHSSVLLELDEGQAKVTVRDDGQGFDPAQVTRRGRVCFGLQTMQERAESVGGTFGVDSQPGNGTQVTVRLPIEGERVASWSP